MIASVLEYLDLAYARPCFLCRQRGVCAHREPAVELADLAALGLRDELAHALCESIIARRVSAARAENAQNWPGLFRDGVNVNSGRVAA